MFKFPKNNSNTQTTPPPSNTKRQQYILLGGGALALAIILTGVLAIMMPGDIIDNAPGKPIKPAGAIQIPGQALTPQDAWVIRGEKAQEAITQELQKLKTDNEQNKLIIRGLMGGSNNPLTLSQDLNRGSQSNNTPLNGVILPNIPNASASNGAVQSMGGPFPPGNPPVMTGVRDSVPFQANPNPGTQIPSNEPEDAELEEILFDEPAQDSSLKPTSAIAAHVNNPAKVKRTTGTWLPAGTTNKAIILGGLDAPTGGQAQNDPHPVLMELTDYSNLPNGFRSKTKECRVIGAGYGDIASERAYIRLVTLSCVLKNGEVIEKAIKGTVYGEDGKHGVRGKLHSKQGQLVAKALFAGMLSGFGSSFSQQGSTVSINPLGSTQTFNPSQVLERGAYTGVSKSMDRLANYYIQSAEKLFPIIEINAMRNVDIVIEQGVDLEQDINNIQQIAYDDDEDDL